MVLTKTPFSQRHFVGMSECILFEVSFQKPNHMFEKKQGTLGPFLHTWKLFLVHDTHDHIFENQGLYLKTHILYVYFL